MSTEKCKKGVVRQSCVAGRALRARRGGQRFLIKNFSHCTPEPMTELVKNSHFVQGIVYQHVATFIFWEVHGEDCPPCLFPHRH